MTHGKKLFYIGFLLFISSCTGSVKDNWTCPTLEGGKGSCVSIKDADIATPLLMKNNNFSYLDSAQNIEIELVSPKLSELKKFNKKNNLDHSDFERQSVTKKLRTQEKIGKIWFAPYIDSEGYHHSESVVYVVDEEAKWVMQK